ncbi:hypothetical protein BCR43DRAFT_528081 [Syncephalastrum racemosum]|uniref:ubiquitinyl hydrolase 1 n=1 Tax=Syncephalastrum racemosum TaxID=13706 RepID=A0A1X2H037_SYNRA|nr:hypothetical protein BCR43DRAFT_528081 [Syncephalastrum racemosum]
MQISTATVVLVVAAVIQVNAGVLSPGEKAVDVVSDTSEYASGAGTHKQLLGPQSSSQSILAALDWQWQALEKSVGPGLSNTSTTCYMNVILQCLSYTPPLTQYLLSQRHWKECPIRLQRRDSFCSLCAMDLHVNRVFICHRSPEYPLRPYYFIDHLKAISPTLRPEQQEDAHEFLTFLLASFQKCILHGQRKLKQKRTETSTWLDAIFGGRIISRVRCHACDTISSTYQTCLGLSLDVDTVSTLEKALGNFIAADVVQEYDCSKCKETGPANKQLMLHRPPMVLSLHLKRFTFDTASGEMRKVNRRVQFPRILDLAPYTLDTDGIFIPYRLYAIVVHAGKSCNKGHYRAYVKSASPQRWYCMDDEQASQSTFFFCFSLELTVLLNDACARIADGYRLERH